MHTSAARACPDYALEVRRTYRDSLRVGLMDEGGPHVLKAHTTILSRSGYVIRVGEVYAYGVVKKSAPSEGTITPPALRPTPKEARRRASELL